jgi:hypothetical protein
MSAGDKFVRINGLKASFRDAHERRAYVRALAIAKHIIDNPDAVQAGMDYLERHVKADPYQRRYYELWHSLIRLAPEEIAATLLEDSDRGAEARGSAPVFVVLSPAR